ncbi:hypothetical protein GALMADRAFT_277912 [Galerina marginata CBS 339.88]|uniref:DUF6534 domain-containing protein n=1 Tax=Galerina marginata (strain CBS 339.88) TaxID=685588 RepID=A0A067TI61_GALM3|nr:hypothetical protein GALMADRAFT_277912 [Galerina marginata CBS 339.88]
MGLNLLGSIFGALLSGVIVNSWLFGCSCSRPSTRLTNQYKNGRFLVSEMIYFYLIISFGDSTTLNIPTWEFALFHGLSAIAAFFVQIYNARRIFAMTKQYMAVATIVLFATVSVAFALGFMAEMFVIGVIDRLHSVSWIAIVWLTCSVVSDLLITGFQVVYLHKHRTGIDKTNRIINILILYILSTGLLTSVPLGGVYTVSFLANLDARRRVREIVPGVHTFKMTSASSQSQGISIEIKHTRQVTTDNSDCEQGLVTELVKLGHKRSTLFRARLSVANLIAMVGGMPSMVFHREKFRAILVAWYSCLSKYGFGTEEA